MITSVSIGLIIFSSLSFLIYGGVCLVSSKMKSEFKRFGLEKFPNLIGILEILGGIGLLVGIEMRFVLAISSGGLALLMFFGLIFRFKAGDNFWSSFPAMLFMVLNGYIFFVALGL
ncbi:DoxX family protein [Salipaludibacillus daqingensis]|uniref:DoxX family protein n=1 Tax=Salipaludibacillus daqingensis TaxID=3041001 RepID=UPI0024732396|nr:DoxX family protein [Salipaludibacillus daqingensis]